jgi:sec-independent protein translocase protein TatB
MFSWSELLLIAVVALIFIGPKELPAALHNLGRIVAKLRRSADEFRRHFEDSMREAGYEELHKNLQDFSALNPRNQLMSSIDRAINQPYAPKPVQPEEAFQPAISESPAEAALPQSASVLAAEKEQQPPPAAQEFVDEPSKDRATPVS